MVIHQGGIHNQGWVTCCVPTSLGLCSICLHYHNLPPTTIPLLIWTIEGRYQLLGEQRVAQLVLTLGTLVSKIPSLLEQPTQPAWAAFPGCWILRCPFVQSIFLRMSERDHYTPSSFIQQR